MGISAKLFFDPRLRWRGSLLSLRTRQAPREIKSKLRAYGDGRFVFVHIPKCGGTTMAGEFFRAGLISSPEPGHFSVREYRAITGRSDGYFAVLRNPEDRFVSAFRYLLHGGGTIHDQKYSDRYIKAFGRDINLFVSALDDVKFKRAVVSWIHFVPQWQFVTIDESGQRLGATVFCLENLVGKKIFDHTFVGANRLNASKTHVDTLSDASKRALRSLYSRDFELYSEAHSAAAADR